MKTKPNKPDAPQPRPELAELVFMADENGVPTEESCKVFAALLKHFDKTETES